MSEQPITLSFSLDSKDYFCGAKLYLDSSKSQKYLRYTILAFILLLFGVSLWGSGMFSCDCESWEDFRYCAQYILEDSWPNFIIFPILLLLIYSDIITKILYRRFVKRSKFAALERHWVISPEQLFCSIDQAESTIKWDFFQKWAENKDYFVLIHDRRMFYPFPKRAFINPADLEKFIALLKEKIPSEK